MIIDARIALRTDIERTRQNFHQLLNTIPEETLTQPSKDPTRTNGELLMQICLTPRLIMSRLKNVVECNWVYPPLLKSLPNPLNRELNELYIRYWARRSTSLSLGIEFDKTCLFALKLLEEMWNEDFETPLFPAGEDGSGNISRKEALDYLICYFDTYSKLLVIPEKTQPAAVLPLPSNHPGQGQSAGH